MFFKRSFLLLLVLLCVGSFYAQSRQHVEVTAQRGQGILSLLRKYQVNTPCNAKYFRQVNGLRSKQGLILGKSYKLPILVYAYNGKSIRTTTAISDLPWAQSIQAYNEALHQSGIKAEDYRKDKVLWVPYSRLKCRSEAFPTASGPSSPSIGAVPSSPSNTASSRPNRVPLRGTYPIFGDEHAAVPLESTRLRGRVYYLVGGHGGPDPGAVGDYYGKKLCEDEYAYDISLRLAKNLLSHGATVYMIIRDENDGIRGGEILPCDKDETCWVGKDIPVSQKLRLTQRSDAINMLYRKNKKQGVRFQRLVVIHVDSQSKREKQDTYFYHKIGDKKSEALADRLKKTMHSKYDQYRPGRGYEGTVTARDLHMLRETEPTAVFIELANIKNRSDQGRLVIEGNRDLMAGWLFEGLLSDAR